MQKLNSNEINQAVNETRVDVRYHKGSLTRETATQIATTALYMRGQTPNIKLIDDLCFMTWGFPISHRKNSPLKTKGGLSVRKRVDRYLHNNHFINYDLHTDTFSIEDTFATRIEAKQTMIKRKRFLFELREKRVISNRKPVSVSKFKKHISNMLYLHIVQAGKDAY